MYIDLITIDLCPGQGGGGVRPSGTLEISGNGLYDVYSYASASVSVHPSISLSETYTSNGSYNITGEFNGGIVNVDVHPSTSLLETYTSNGSYSISGEFNGGEITIEVPAPQFITETLSVSSNGTYIPSVGVDGFSEVVVNVPQSGTGYTEAEMTEGAIININNNASYVGSYAFYMNGTIQTANLPNCSLVGRSAFGYTTIVSVNLPVCKKISYGGFLNCSSLSQIILPSCEEIIQYGFVNCNSLSEVSLPVCSYIGPSAFEGCKLSSIVLPMATNIEQNAFRNCNMLSKITLGASSVCSISNITLFIGTLISSNTGSIYVPASLVDTYKSAPIWSYYSNIIFPISE